MRRSPAPNETEFRTRFEAGDANPELQAFLWTVFINLFLELGTMIGPNEYAALKKYVRKFAAANPDIVVSGTYHPSWLLDGDLIPPRR